MFSKKTLVALSFIWTLLIANAQTFLPLGAGTNSSVRAMKAYNGYLYAVGTFTNAGGIPANHIARWNGVTWDSVGSGIHGGIPYSLEVYNNELYVGGAFTMAGNITVTGIAKWDGINWSNVGQLGPDPTGLTTSLRVFNGALYAGGYPNTISNATNCDVAKWDGANWTSSGMTGLFGGWGNIVLDTCNSDLYAGGYGGGGVAKLNGLNWLSLGGGLSGPVNSLISHNSQLYVGGQFIEQGSFYLTQWNGSNFLNANNFAGQYVFAMFNFNNELFVGGGGTQFAGDNLSKWNGVNWVNYGLFSESVGCFAEYNNELYIGGYFYDAAGTLANNIVKLNSTLGVKNIENNARIISISPNPATDGVYIEVKNLKGQEYKLKLYNPMGQLIKTIDQRGSHKIKIETSGFSKGLYFIQLWLDNCLGSSEKIIIE
jgi:hypothetical protein